MTGALKEKSVTRLWRLDKKHYRTSQNANYRVIKKQKFLYLYLSGKYTKKLIYFDARKKSHVFSLMSQSNI